MGMSFIGNTDRSDHIALHSSGNVCTLAGYISNRQSLIAELKERGIPTHPKMSDASLMVTAYELWGNDTFQRLGGNYSGAIWNQSSRSITLVRSPTGGIPLFYSFFNGRLVFGTEAKICLSDPESNPKFNEYSLFDFFTLLSVPPPYSMFKGVSKVEAGSWIRMSPDGDFRSGRFWPFAELVEERKKQGNEALSQSVLRKTRQALINAGTKDDRLGIFLDGGLTASATALGLAKYCPAKVATYSVLLTPPSKEDLENTKKTAEELKKLGIPHHVVRLDAARFLGLLPQIAALQDEPNNLTADVLFHVAAEAAAKHGVTRMVNPVGANAIFLRLLRWTELARKVRTHERKSTTWLREASVGIAKLAKRPMGENMEQMERSLEGLPVYWSYRELFTRDEKFQLLSGRLKHEFEERSSWNEIAPYWSRFERWNKEQAIEDWMPFLEVVLGLPEGLCMRHDQVVHAAGIPQYMPYLEPALVVDTLALHSITRDAERLPRTTFEKVFGHLLPNVALNAGAHGISKRSVSTWFFENLSNSWEEQMEEFFRQSDLLDRRTVREMMRSKDHDRRWHIYNFIQWWKGWFGV